MCIRDSRRSVLEKVQTFNENFKVSEDWDFWARVSAAGFKFHYMKAVSYTHLDVYKRQALTRADFNITKTLIQLPTLFLTRSMMRWKETN